MSAFNLVQTEAGSSTTVVDSVAVSELELKQIRLD